MVDVIPYEGGTQEALTIRAALHKKQAPSEGAGITRTTNSAAPDFTSALEAQIAHQHSAKREEQRTRKRLGLGPKASEPEVQEMTRLVAEIESALERLLKNPKSLSNIAPQSDGTRTLLRQSFQISRPDSLPVMNGITAHTSLCLMAALPFVALGHWGVAPGVLAVMTASILQFFGVVFFESLKEFRPFSYLKGPLQSREPGSLGAVVDSFHNAGLNCVIRVGASNEEEMRVDLKVTYKPKTKE